MSKRKVGSPESEAALLGAIIHNPESLPVAQAIVADADFLTTANRTIFRNIERLAKAGLPFDVVTLMDLATGTGNPDDFDALMAALGRTELRWHMPQHAQRVAATADAHNLSVRLFALANRAQSCDPVTDLDGIAAEARALKVRSHKKPRTNYDQAAEVLAEAQGGARGSRLPTGIESLDRVLQGGCRRKTMAVIAAPPGGGKSALGVNIASHVRKAACGPVLFFSLEMSDTPIMQRMVADRADVSATDLTGGTVDQDAMCRVQHTLAELAEDDDLHIIDASGWKLAKICAEAEAWHAVKPLAAIVVDYLQFVHADAPTKNREQDVSSIAKGLKELAAKLDCAMYALAQIGREPEKENRRPRMSDLRESGAIEQNAHIIVFLHRPDPNNPTATEAIIAKNRDGRPGFVRLAFEGDRQRFTDAGEGGYGRPADAPLPTGTRRQATATAKATRQDNRYGNDR